MRKDCTYDAGAVSAGSFANGF